MNNIAMNSDIIQCLQRYAHSELDVLHLLCTNQAYYAWMKYFRFQNFRWRYQNNVKCCSASCAYLHQYTYDNQDVCEHLILHDIQNEPFNLHEIKKRWRKNKVIINKLQKKTNQIAAPNIKRAARCRVKSKPRKATLIDDENIASPIKRLPDHLKSLRLTLRDESSFNNLHICANHRNLKHVELHLFTSLNIIFQVHSQFEIKAEKYNAGSSQFYLVIGLPKNLEILGIYFPIYHLSLPLKQLHTLKLLWLDFALYSLTSLQKLKVKALRKIQHWPTSIESLKCKIDDDYDIDEEDNEDEERQCCFDQIPDHVKHIKISGSSNQMIKHFPAQLCTLIIRSPVDIQTTFPSNLIYLKLMPCCMEQVFEHHLPDTLQYLSLNSFDRCSNGVYYDIQYLPSKLQYLKLKNHREIKIACEFSPTLKTIIMPEYELESHLVLPQSLMRLHVKRFESILPESLSVLRASFVGNMLFENSNLKILIANKYANTLSLPDSLTELHILKQCCIDLDCVLPSSLNILHIENYNGPLHLSSSSYLKYLRLPHYDQALCISACQLCYCKTKVKFPDMQ